MTCINIEFRCNDEAVNDCHDLAIKTLSDSIRPFKDGLLESPQPAVLAGEMYNSPWTRDTAYNVWNAAALLAPQAAKNTLLAVLMKDEGQVRIGGQYWDAIAWVTGAWHYYLVTGDADLLRLAYEATANSLDHLERTQLDALTGLFMGPASYGDGVSSYPPPYDATIKSPSILDYPFHNPHVGKIRMKTLSTNCLYYAAYVRGGLMEQELGLHRRRAEWAAKAASLKDNINQRLWMAKEGRYGYFLGNENELHPHMEGLGHSLAILLEVAAPQQARAILENQYVSPHGVPCVWPIFDKYRTADRLSCGRHNGTVWPFINAFWAQAAGRYDRQDLLEHELATLTGMFAQARNFWEIFHPVTGRPYGGLQIDRNGTIKLWDSCQGQTWSATGYMRVLYNVIAGMDFTAAGLSIRPRLTTFIDRVQIKGIAYRNCLLELDISASPDGETRIVIDGKPAPQALVSPGFTGSHRVEMRCPVPVQSFTRRPT